MRQYKEFKEIKAKFKKEVLKDQKQFKNDLKNNSIEKIKSWWIFDKLTKKQKEKTAAEVRKILIEKRIKEDSKRIESFNNKCDEIAKAEPCKNINISVSWAKNRTWGANPTAEITAGGQYTTGSASGCGYDKLSSAISYALNKNNSVLNRLYNAYEKELRKDKEASLRESIGYGCGYGARPAFNYGVGYGCFRSIFAKLGAKVNTWQEGKNWDAMTIEF